MSATAPSRLTGTGRRTRTDLAARLESPVATFYVLLAVTVALVIFGLVMVLSASAVVSLSETDSPYTVFLDQLVFVAIGTVACAVAVRMSPQFWKVMAVPAIVAAIGLQMLVFSPLGAGEVNGNTNWIDLGVGGFQPSEAIKIGLVLFGALVLGHKRERLAQVRHVVFPFLLPVSLAAIGLVLNGHDLGTALVLIAIVGGVMWTAGVSGGFFVVSGGLAAVAATGFVVTSDNRLQRLQVWLGQDTDPFGAARQPLHGRYALADGGWTGVGLGQSREKWQWLSEPHNDFIFAIIGEELGLAGTLLVLGLFAVLAWACLRLIRRTDDTFVRIATAGLMTWIVAQAMVNIGSVIGLLPVIGVPLPLVSSGGSSLVTTMLALGILLSFARAEPGCREALANRPGLTGHLTGWVARVWSRLRRWASSPAAENGA